MSKQNHPMPALSHVVPIPNNAKAPAFMIPIFKLPVLLYRCPGVTLVCVQ